MFKKIRLAHIVSGGMTLLQAAVLATSLFYSLIPFYAEVLCLTGQMHVLKFFLHHIIISNEGTNRLASVIFAFIFAINLFTNLFVELAHIYHYGRQWLTNISWQNVLNSYLELAHYFKHARGSLFKGLIYPFTFFSIMASLQGININIPSYILIPLSLATGLMANTSAKTYLLGLYAKCLQPILKNQKTDPNDYIHGYSPLFYALKAKNLALIDALLKRGANPNLPVEKAGVLTPIWSYFFPNKFPFTQTNFLVCVAMLGGQEENSKDYKFSVSILKRLSALHITLNPNQTIKGKPLLLWCLQEDKPNVAKILLKFGLNCLPADSRNEIFYALAERIDSDLTFNNMIEFIHDNENLTEEKILAFLEHNRACDETELRDFIKNRTALVSPEFYATRHQYLLWHSVANRYLHKLNLSECLPYAGDKSGVSSLFELASNVVKDLQETARAEQHPDPLDEHFKSKIKRIPISKQASTENKAFYEQLVNRPVGMFRP